MSELHIVIEAFIRENGGCKKLIHDIECEWCKSFIEGKRVDWKNSERIFLLKNHNEMTYSQMATTLNRSVNSIKGQMNYLYERSLIDYKNYI